MSNPTSLVGSGRQRERRADTGSHPLRLSHLPPPTTLTPYRYTSPLDAPRSSRTRRWPCGLYDNLPTTQVQSGPAWTYLSWALLIKTPDVRREHPSSLKGDITGVGSLAIPRLPVTLRGHLLSFHPTWRLSRQMEAPVARGLYQGE